MPEKSHSYGSGAGDACGTRDRSISNLHEIALNFQSQLRGFGIQLPLTSCQLQTTPEDLIFTCHSLSDSTVGIRTLSSANDSRGQFLREPGQAEKTGLANSANFQSLSLSDVAEAQPQNKLL